MTRGELEQKGFKVNTHLPISGGFFNCPNCKMHTHHIAMSYYDDDLKWQFDVMVCPICNKSDNRHEINCW